ncbi:unnamed protein product [Arabis nemorensis]|uniref:Uncharacterized protein n=1 Tax=Arabis nemorensis TaxID=586526 RepID=A0A565C651_9BRAS|nr:unnamed protein product [Arabis nemorensis]
MHVDSMKRARVSSMYEGKERYRSSEGDKARRDHSKHARMTAKARMNVHKESMKSPTKDKKVVMTMKSMRKNDKTHDYQKTVIIRAAEKVKEDKDNGEVENMEEETELPLSRWVEEWPEMLTYEEEWTWFAFMFGWGCWWRYDKVMNGESWYD